MCSELGWTGIDDMSCYEYANILQHKKLINIVK